MEQLYLIVSIYTPAYVNSDTNTLSKRQFSEVQLYISDNGICRVIY